MILDYKLSLWNRKRMCDIIINDFFIFIQIPKTSTTNVLNSCKKKKISEKITLLYT